MKAITLRNFPASLDRTIRQRAKKKGVSVNIVVISLLQDHLGESEMQPVCRYHDLDGFAGSWSKQETEAFEETLAQQRAIDPEMWKSGGLAGHLGLFRIYAWRCCGEGEAPDGGCDLPESCGVGGTAGWILTRPCQAEKRRTAETVLGVFQGVDRNRG